MIPILYSANEKDFDHNGIGSLVDTISCTVTEERNGMFELEFEYPLAGALYDYIQEDCIVKAVPNDTSPPQLFRVYRSSKPINGRVTFYAEHISYLLNGFPIESVEARSINAKDALARVLSASVVDHNFTSTSDIQTLNSFSLSLLSVRAALGGAEGSILDVYGGEYEFDNFSVKLHTRRGSDTGMKIAYGKNLTDLIQEKNISETYTGVMPYARYTPTSDVGTDGEEVIVTLPERVIYSPYAERYAHTRILIRDFSDKFDDGEVITADALRQKIRAWVETSGFDIPKVSITVTFQDLRRSPEYADYAFLEKVALCDTATVEYDALGVSTTAKVIKTIYDVLKEQYNSIGLGDARSNFADTINQYVSDAERAERETKRRFNAVNIRLAQADAALKELQRALADGSGLYPTTVTLPDGSSIYYLHDKPILEESETIIKVTSEAIGFSNDGGRTYPYGITLDGKTITRLLYAEGINADYIDAGAITVRDASGDIIFSVNIDEDKVFMDGGYVRIGAKTVAEAMEDTAGEIALVKESIAELTVEQGKITARVAEAVSDAIDNITIGSTQILRGTNAVTALTSSGTWAGGTWRSASAGTGTRESIAVTDAPNANIKVGWRIERSAGNVDVAQDYVPVAYGQVYTMSCYARAVSGTAALRLQTWKATSAAHSTTINVTDTGWQRYSFTFSHDFADYRDNTNIYFGNGGSGVIEICGMKLEAGSVATDWSPAPEDTSSEIASVKESLAELTVEQGKITARVIESESTANAAKDAVDNLSIGGRNLLPGTRTMEGYYISTPASMSFAEDAEGTVTAAFAPVGSAVWRHVGTRPPIPLSAVRGKQVTFSFDIRSDDWEALNADTSHGLVVPFALCTASSETRTLYRNIVLYTATLSKDWQRITITATLSDDFFTTGTGEIDDTTRFYVQIYNYSAYSMQVRRFKLEFGNVPTDWSPAPEDAEGAIETLASELTLQAGEIAAKVEKTEGTSSSSFGWSLIPEGWSLYSNGKTVLSADKTGLSVTGEINATSGKIGGDLLVDGTVTAGKLAAGSITADKIAAGTVTADKIAVGNYNNLCAVDPDESNLYGATVTTISGQKYFRLGNASTAGYYSLVLRDFPAGTTFSSGDRYLLRAKGYHTSSVATNVILRVYYTDGTNENLGNTTLTVPTSNGNVTGNFSIYSTPSKAVSYVRLFCETTSASAGYVYLRDITVYQMGTASLIVDGAVTADKIAANAVTAEKLSVNSLSAITADLGTVTAGVIKSSNYAANSVGSQINLADGVINCSALSAQGYLIGGSWGSGKFTTMLNDLGLCIISPWTYATGRYKAWIIATNSSGYLTATPAIYEQSTNSWTTQDAKAVTLASWAVADGGGTSKGGGGNVRSPQAVVVN